MKINLIDCLTQWLITSGLDNWNIRSSRESVGQGRVLIECKSGIVRTFENGMKVREPHFAIDIDHNTVNLCCGVEHNNGIIAVADPNFFSKLEAAMKFQWEALPNPKLLAGLQGTKEV